MPVPSTGRDVHYLSHGTPLRADGSQAYGQMCRAAKITGMGEPLPYPIVGDHPEPLEDGTQLVDLVVFNPEGLFVKDGVPQDERPAGERAGGTWHWPERVGN
jgi:hypothetical protein